MLVEIPRQYISTYLNNGSGWFFKDVIGLETIN